MKEGTPRRVFEDKTAAPLWGGRLSGVFRLILPDKALDVRGLAAAFGAQELEDFQREAEGYVGLCDAGGFATRPLATAAAFGFCFFHFFVYFCRKQFQKRAGGLRPRP